MSYLCLSPAEHLNPLLFFAIVPNVVVDRALVWCDIRGLPTGETLVRIERLVAQSASEPVNIGIAATPIVAALAAKYGSTTPAYVPAGMDRAFLAPFGITVLHPDRVLSNLLDGAGIETCGELAGLSSESVELRFGRDGVALWRLARADDPRRIFGAIPRPLPEASLEWTHYTLRRAERLVFVLNGLCDNVCTSLRSRGHGAVSMTLVFTLPDRTVSQHAVRAARATASHSAWMRLLRLALEQIVLPGGVEGITLRVDAVGSIGGTQGDVFDRGFGTSQAAEEALSGILDDQGAVVVEPRNTQHPLVDRRTSWMVRSAVHVIDQDVVGRVAPVPQLTLQLLSTPKPVEVATINRHNAEIPNSYHDGRTMHILFDVAGPDCVSGGQWSEPYAREYFRCVTDDGVLVWLYRDVYADRWYLHGWWD